MARVKVYPGKDFAQTPNGIDPKFLPPLYSPPILTHEPSAPGTRMTAINTSPAGDSQPVGRVWLVIAMLTLAALGNLRLPIRSFGEISSGKTSDGINEFLSRCRRLEPHLPANGAIGYRAPPTREQTFPPVKGDRLQLMRYALAPRIVEQFWDHQLVIFDADDPALSPSPKESRGWRVVADLGDGMKVYRTTGDE
jgi:hypothetical protein